MAQRKRLRKSQAWLHALCAELFREQGVAVSAAGGFAMRALDATTVKEPGKTGSLWRLHYSVSLPSLACEFFKLTATEGPGTGESFRQFPIRAGDCILADRGYSAAGGHVAVRVNTGALPLQVSAGRPFGLLAAVSALASAGTVGSWPARVVARQGPPVLGRVCAIRKTEAEIKIALEGIRKEVTRKGRRSGRAPCSSPRS